jgi:hypothetical protein
LAYKSRRKRLKRGERARRKQKKKTMGEKERKTWRRGRIKAEGDVRKRGNRWIKKRKGESRKSRRTQEGETEEKRTERWERKGEKQS